MDVVVPDQADTTAVVYLCGDGASMLDPSELYDTHGLWSSAEAGERCGAKNSVKPQDQIRCRACGYRILYKTRTKRMVQHEAR